MSDFNPADWTFDQFSGKRFQIGIESWVRATHIPTGVSAVSSSERNQILNRNKAVAVIYRQLKLTASNGTHELLLHVNPLRLNPSLKIS